MADAIVFGVGASAGLGGALCRRFAREGLAVLAAGRTPAKLEPIVDQIKATGGRASSIVCDVTLEREETRAFVRAQIDRLPDTYRTVLLLRDIEELSTAEVASMLNASENAVKIRLHRARQALHALLDERFGRRASEANEVTR